MNYCKIRRFSPVEVRLIKHRPVTGRASADLLRDIRKSLAYVRHRTMPDWVPGRSPLESHDLNFQQKSSGARPMCAGRCHFAIIYPTKRRTGAVEF